MYAYVIY